MKEEILDYDPLGTKEALSKFIEIYNYEIALPNLNKQRGIVKKIIFLKLFVDSHLPSHYSKSMVFDILSALNSLKENRERYYHFNIRSFIENLLRTILNLQDSDKTGVNALFRESLILCQTIQDEETLIHFFENKYQISNNYVHSNVLASMEIHQFYKNILEQTIPTARVSQILDQLYTLLTKASELIIRRFSNEIEHIFFKKKATLSFLVNKSLFSLHTELQNQNNP